MLAAANNDPKKTDQAKAAAENAKQKAPPKPRRWARSSTPPRPTLKAKQDAVAAAEAAAKAAEAKRIETAKAAKDAKLAGEPVSIFISRATQKLYVRRDTHKKWPDGGELYDFSQEFPITIKDPDKPIGTHIFTAVARAEGGLRWTEVSIDNGDSAKDALDRITFPQEVLDRIAPTAVPLSSITISDEPLSGETNYRTEFVAVLSNQPQGGFITRAAFARHAHRARPGRRRLFGLGWFGYATAAAKQTAEPRSVLLLSAGLAELLRDRRFCASAQPSFRYPEWPQAGPRKTTAALLRHCEKRQREQFGDRLH